ncbi:MAG: methyltransferase domain-containing protein [Chloroflexi bacterium]|nr:methyltransferase domain-containing protein [Chloroflexota bacterium]
MTTQDPRIAAQRRFVTADACLTAADIIGQYATDVDATTETLVDAIRPERANARICELGFGLGWLLEALAKEFPEASLVGLDQSPGMAAHVRELLGAQATIVQGDMERLPFADATFDSVATCWTLYFMTDIDATLEEIKRTLRPGGRLVAATVAPDNQIELDELYHSAVEAALGPRERVDVTERFNLETGRPYVERHFREVELREWRGELKLPDVATLVAFWEGGWAKTLLGDQMERVRTQLVRLAEEWLARDGALNVTRHGGLFIGRV